VKAHFLQTLIAIRASYWFWPTVMAIGAIFLAAITLEIDARISPEWINGIPLLSSDQPEGARALLATVAGSMITVTGITFSLTLLAVSHATSQFGPRLLTNFMKDLGNQITLGTFVATFLYCLTILRTVRSAEEPSQAGDPTNDLLGAFVPHISIFTAFILTLASVGVLIYFIHHIPESIRLSNVVSKIGRQLLVGIESLFPQSLAQKQLEEQGEDPRLLLPDNFTELAVKIVSPGDGYIQTIDESGLRSFAVNQDTIIQLCARPGDFVSEGDTVMLVGDSNITNDQCDALRYMFALGTHRTATQNSLFLVDQLVEVAARALSPGVNDPMTAITCIDWLRSALIQVGLRDDPDEFRFDKEGELRIIANSAKFEQFCSAVFDQLRPYVATDRNAALHLMKMNLLVSKRLTDTKRKAVLRRFAEELLEATSLADFFPADQAKLREIYDS